MDALSMLWDNVSRDLNEERAELARTAALADAEKTLWPLMSGAADANDLGHRLALADNQISLIAARRGYDRGDLVGDLMRRWQLLAEAKLATTAKQLLQQTEEQAAARGRETADLAYFQAVATLTARAASDNPGLPLRQCQALAEEALAKQADAYPLAYESYGDVKDGPLTSYVKNWQPPKVKQKAKDPGDPGTGDGGSGMFDDVSARLDAAEQRINGMGGGGGSPASGPGGPTGPKSASHQHEAGPFTDRIKGLIPGRKPKGRTPSPNDEPGMFDEVNNRLDQAVRKVPTKPSEATPGNVPNLNLDEYLKGPDRAVEQNSYPNAHIFSSDPDDSGFNRVHSPDFADRRIDEGLQKIRDEQARSDATEPSFDDRNSNMERALDRGEQANQQHGAAPGFDQPHDHSHSHPSNWEQGSLWENV